MKPPPLSLEEAQQRLLALAPALPVEHRAVGDCAGFYLAEPLAALRTQPAAALSAMDGYAVSAGDPGPWRVVGESAAGHPLDRGLRHGEAARISTGAIVPDGGDCVLLQEDCAREGVMVSHLEAMPAAGRHIRRAGLDFSTSDPILPAGTRIGAAQLALAIAAGHDHLAVRRAVRLTLIDCGDELVPPGSPCHAHQLPASNAPMLAAMAAGLPIEIRRLGPIPDRLGALADALDAAREADIVVTSGGASVGKHDLIRPALDHAGASIDFWRVAIKPGKPLLVARRPKDIGDQVILGLPGNPASAFVTGFLFMLPLLREALGAAQPLPRPFAIRLAEPLPPGGRRMEFLRARWADGKVRPEPEQDSGALRPLAHANALICRAIGAPAAQVGEEVPTYWLENGGIA
ncbi:MAG: molybdopterin molybdotransferase MoeA [Novosphingobium sp.]|nr:molybdopterin molybdotransferase MoeA [Novosphingobium sp.]